MTTVTHPAEDALELIRAALVQASAAAGALAAVEGDPCSAYNIGVVKICTGHLASAADRIEELIASLFCTSLDEQDARSPVPAPREAAG